MFPTLRGSKNCENMRADLVRGHAPEEALPKFLDGRGKGIDELMIRDQEDTKQSHKSVVIAGMCSQSNTDWAGANTNFADLFDHLALSFWTVSATLIHLRGVDTEGDGVHLRPDVDGPLRPLIGRIGRVGGHPAVVEYGLDLEHLHSRRRLEDHGDVGRSAREDNQDFDFGGDAAGEGDERIRWGVTPHRSVSHKFFEGWQLESVHADAETAEDQKTHASGLIRQTIANGFFGQLDICLLEPKTARNEGRDTIAESSKLENLVWRYPYPPRCTIDQQSEEFGSAGGVYTENHCQTFKDEFRERTTKDHRAPAANGGRLDGALAVIRVLEKGCEQIRCRLNRSDGPDPALEREGPPPRQTRRSRCQVRPERRLSLDMRMSTGMDENVGTSLSGPFE
ncbi:hypothetical protein B0H17DRAFT_1128167 [Mycena rosella]|uniref:Uncharacterized protein n=1 Tax=Mycena rosella TaxID=1033263 RepID=A0AAD7DZZ8_MYCRO|nr:hypothetical protein B0H17DRAFT_1128167 [Mycena rosella]